MWIAFTYANYILKGLAQAKIINKSVILFWLLNMTICCKHVHRLELQFLFNFWFLIIDNHVDDFSRFMEKHYNKQLFSNCTIFSSEVVRVVAGWPANGACKILWKSVEKWVEKHALLIILRKNYWYDCHLTNSYSLVIVCVYHCTMAIVISAQIWLRCRQSWAERISQ